MLLEKDLIRITQTLPQFDGPHTETDTYSNKDNIRTLFGYTSWATALLHRLPSEENKVKQLCREALKGINIIEGVCIAYPSQDTWTDTRFEVYLHYTPDEGYMYRACTYSTGHAFTGSSSPKECPYKFIKTDNLNTAMKYLIDTAEEYDDGRVDKSKLKELISMC